MKAYQWFIWCAFSFVGKGEKMMELTLTENLSQNGINCLGFGNIPKSIMQDQRLTLEAKSIYAYLASFTGIERIAFPSKETILQDLGMSEKRYYKHRKLLEKFGYISMAKVCNKAGVVEKNIFYLEEHPSENHQTEKKTIIQKFKDLISGKSKKTSQPTKIEKSLEMPLNQLNSQNDRPLNSQNDRRNNTIINNTNISNKAIESQAELTEKMEKTTYCHQTHLFNQETKETIAFYAQNQKGFDLDIALTIEKDIFGAKKVATHQLIQQGLLSKDKLVEKNHQRIYELDLHEVPINDWLQNIFLRLKRAVDFNRIHDQKKYFFSALVQEFYTYIKGQIMSKNDNASNDSQEKNIQKIQKRQGIQPAWDKIENQNETPEDIEYLKKRLARINAL